MGLMKTKAISSIFVLFAIAAGMASMAPAAFADHAEVSIITVTNPDSHKLVQHHKEVQVAIHQSLQQLTSAVS